MRQLFLARRLVALDEMVDDWPTITLARESCGLSDDVSRADTTLDVCTNIVAFDHRKRDSGEELAILGVDAAPSSTTGSLGRSGVGDETSLRR